MYFLNTKSTKLMHKGTQSLSDLGEILYVALWLTYMPRNSLTSRHKKKPPFRRMAAFDLFFK